jgi:hypothetical protein
MNKSQLAGPLHTSRSQVDRLARAVGKQLRIEFAWIRFALDSITSGQYRAFDSKPCRMKKSAQRALTSCVGTEPPTHGTAFHLQEQTAW